jgi:hypothetical protein
MQATRRRGQEGVTFVELAVTSIIVGLLAALAIPHLPGAAGPGRRRERPVAPADVTVYGWPRTVRRAPRSAAPAAPAAPGEPPQGPQASPRQAESQNIHS